MVNYFISFQAKQLLSSAMPLNVLLRFLLLLAGTCGSQHLLCLVLLPVSLKLTLLLQDTTLALDAHTTEDTEHGRSVDQRKDGGEGQTTNDSHTQRSPHLSTHALPHSHRQQAKNRGERGQQDWTQAGTCCYHGRTNQTNAALTKQLWV